MGATETWGDAPAAPAATPGFEAAGFETAGVCRVVLGCKVVCRMPSRARLVSIINVQFCVVTEQKVLCGNGAESAGSMMLSNAFGLLCHNGAVRIDVSINMFLLYGRIDVSILREFYQMCCLIRRQLKIICLRVNVFLFYVLFYTAPFSHS